ncbi:MAG: hypothetical protein IJH61_01115, partial [Eubacteriaceae bacterium]|nr:hypothetical protein [Eubacteriaceae bacterium]
CILFYMIAESRENYKFETMAMGLVGGVRWLFWEYVWSENRRFGDKPELLRYAPAIRRPFAPALSRYVLMSVGLAQSLYALLCKHKAHTTIGQGLIAQKIAQEGDFKGDILFS